MRADEERSAVSALAAAMSDGDLDGIRAVLHPEVELVIDVGPPGGAPEGRGADAAARLATLASAATVTVSASVNGHPGVVLSREGVVVAVVTTESRGGLLEAVWVVCNPDKLRHWNVR